MGRNDSGLDLLFGIIGFIIDIALESNRTTNTTGFFSDISNERYNTGIKTNKGWQHKVNFDTTENYSNTPVKKDSNEISKTIIKTVDKRKAQKKIKPTTKQIKLEALLLNYMFVEDDGRISLKERVEIKSHYKDALDFLTKDDIEYLKDIKDMDSSLLNIRSFISQNDVSETEISKSISTMKSIGNGAKKYNHIISRVEAALLNTMGY